MFNGLQQVCFKINILELDKQPFLFDFDCKNQYLPKQENLIQNKTHFT